MSSWLLGGIGLFLIPKTPIIQDGYSPISPDVGRYKRYRVSVRFSLLNLIKED